MLLQILHVKITYFPKFSETVAITLLFDKTITDRTYKMINVTTLQERPCEIHNTMPNEGRNFS